ncbi:MAG: hypothetical protein ACM3XM_16955 [Mycobacterium leprae]
MTKWMVTAVSGALILFGLVILLQSPTMGLSAANSWLRGLPGGGTDTAQFMAMIAGFTESYRLLGGILLGGGVFGALQQLRDLAR